VAVALTTRAVVAAAAETVKVAVAVNPPPVAVIVAVPDLVPNTTIAASLAAVSVVSYVVAEVPAFATVRK